MCRNMCIVIMVVLMGGFFVGCGAGQSTSVMDNASSTTGKAAKSVPEFPPAEDFVAEIDNPFLEFERGRVFTYESDTADGHETNVVEVTQDTKTILGVNTTVVHDQVFLDGELTEETFDWYAQDSDGNVWYFGEDSKTIENGSVVSTEGSWEAGVDGALPGIIMLADPVNGTKYQQEFAEGVAEDMAIVLNLSKDVEVPFGFFEGCLKTEEWTPLSPGAREIKFYAPGTGFVLEVEPKSGRILTELTNIEN